MKSRECFNQTDLEKALSDKVIPILMPMVDNGWYRLFGDSYAVLRGSSHAELWGSSHAELWGSSHAVLRESSHAVLRESSHAVLRESSHAELWGSSHAELWGSSHAVLRESSHAVLRESSHAEGSKFTAIHKSSPRAEASGSGVIIELPDLAVVENWLDFWDVKVVKKAVVLYKAVSDQFKSQEQFSYAPGSKPIAPDFNVRNECGGGLHLCATPRTSQLMYFNSATKFVACTVKVDDIIPITDSAGRSDKVKVRAISKCVEVDVRGEPLRKAGE
jgi:hypothetical protein